MSDPLLSLVVAEPRRAGRGSLAGLLVVGALAAGVVTVLDDVGVVDAAGVAAAVAPLAADVADIAPTRPQPPPVVTPAAQPALGAVAGLAVAVPSHRPVLVSYHEASFPEALPIAPAGRVAGNDNPTRAYERADAAGPAYLVQVSRGRAQGPTTAVDVVIRDGDDVLAPVAGTVTQVLPYRLYGEHDDVRLELRPDDRPDLRVVLIHVEDVTVAEGDRVEVGDVLAGGARLFPFEAVVDRATAPQRYGHVHLEVKRPAADG